MSISFASQGETAIFSGDVMHSPAKIYWPEWNSVFCAQQEQARASRQTFLDMAAEHRARVFTAHFPQSSAGTVKRTEDGFEWAFL